MVEPLVLTPPPEPKPPRRRRFRMTQRRLAILAEALRFGTVRRVGQTMPFEALVAAGLLEPAEHFRMYRASAEGVRAYGVAVGTHTED